MTHIVTFAGEITPNQTYPDKYTDVKCRTPRVHTFVRYGSLARKAAGVV